MLIASCWPLCSHRPKRLSLFCGRLLWSGTRRNQLIAAWLIVAQAAAAFPLLRRHASCRQVTSSTHCQRFSTCQGVRVWRGIFSARSKNFAAELPCVVGHEEGFPPRPVGADGVPIGSCADRRTAGGTAPRGCLHGVAWLAERPAALPRPRRIAKPFALRAPAARLALQAAPLIGLLLNALPATPALSFPRLTGHEPAKREGPCSPGDLAAALARPTEPGLSPAPAELLGRAALVDLGIA